MQFISATYLTVYDLSTAPCSVVSYRKSEEVRGSTVDDNTSTLLLRENNYNKPIRKNPVTPLTGLELPLQ